MVNQRSKRVVIIGGGLAGLSAAEALSRRAPERFEITVLEAKRAAGGRAGSFTDPASGQVVDYCQHVAMGCCTNLIGLLERCGLAGMMQRYGELRFLHPNHPPSLLVASRYLPPPLHLARALGAMRYLKRQPRRRVRQGLWRLFRSRDDQLRSRTATEWLRENGQDAETIRDFWSVIVVSALGEHTDVVSMAAVRKVFVDGFAASRGASDVLVPKLPLGELFGRRLRAAIEKLGVKVITGAACSRVVQRESDVAVQTQAGPCFQGDHVISAVAWHSIADVLSRRQLPQVDRFAQFPASRITGLHLWFDRQLTELPHAVMVGTVAQWLFRQPWHDPASNSQCYYQVVISASHRASGIARDQLVERVVDELRAAFAAAREAKLLRYRIVSDPNSVFSVRPEVEAMRPAARTALPWLHLAGDWTATGWPATMEGAVISGRLAARSILEQEAMRGVDVDPGLPRGLLARQILGS